MTSVKDGTPQRGMLHGMKSARDPSALSDRLVMAARHVEDARRIVARQRETVAELKADHHNTTDAERTLQLFEQTLAIFEAHNRDIQKQMEDGRQ